MFERLRPPPPDALVAIGAAFRADPRTEKIDLGIGVYRDANSDCRVFQTVKTAERVLLETQPSKAYVGQLGDAEFCDRLGAEVFGRRRFAELGENLVTAQAPGGTGALRLAAELVRAGRDRPTAWISDPSWPAHEPLLLDVGFEVRAYPYVDAASGRPDIAGLCEALSHAKAGDLVLLQGCCHNPTGADLAREHWLAVSRVCLERGLIPLIDLAYVGLGEGIEADAWGVRWMLDTVPEALVAVSCSKAFGLYRERTGALFVKCETAAGAKLARAQLTVVARVLWSMPPDHGAAVVRTILADPGLVLAWREEVKAMRERLRRVRSDLADVAGARGLDLSGLKAKLGLFALMPVDAAQLRALREDHAIYLADNGRANLAGLGPTNLERFIDALASVTRLAAGA